MVKKNEKNKRQRKISFSAVLSNFKTSVFMNSIKSRNLDVILFMLECFHLP